MRRIPQLDGLRAAAILMVFATHALHVPLLWMGVDLFFILSGYLITRILLTLKQEPCLGYWMPFYSRRALRILPPLAVFLLGCGFLFSIPWERIWYWYVFFGANIAQSFGKSHIEALSPLWSLSVEEQFYLIWPLVVLLCTTRRLKAVALWTIFISPCLRAIATPLFSNHFPIYYLTFFRADTLCVGAFIAASEALDPNWVKAYSHNAMQCSGCALLIFSAFQFLAQFRTSANSVLFNSLAYSLSAIFFGGILVYVLGKQDGVTISLLTFTPVRYLGRISYTFYLWHVAILIGVSNYFHSRPAIAILAFIVTATMSAISWQYAESPLLNWRTHHKKEKRMAVAA